MNSLHKCSSQQTNNKTKIDRQQRIHEKSTLFRLIFQMAITIGAY